MTLCCLVCDLDDTLYLERDYVRSGFRHLAEWLAAERGIHDFFEVAWSLFLQGVRRTIFDQALERLGLHPDADLIADMVHRYRTHKPEIALLPDAQWFLQATRNLPARAIVTDGPPASQQRKVKALGLDSEIPLVVYTWQWGKEYGKPHPRGFRYVESRTGFSGHQCCYVADNPAKDFAAPKALGWLTVRVRRPGSLSYAETSDSDIDMEVTDLREAGACLGLPAVCFHSRRM